MGLKDEIHDYVNKTFGSYSAQKIDDFAQQIDSNINKKEFLDKCVDFLSTLLGTQKAKDEMKVFYEKYQVRMDD
ncbi:MAG: hypothetical protein ACLFPJ_01610 [Candidatus Woesearchaeota archaeon]